MLCGIGNDIIEIHRIHKAINKYGKKFLDKIFTFKEQEYCLKYAQSERHFSGRFAAKEAIVKALGCGFRDGITWLDIEICNEGSGRPYVVFSHKLNELFGDVEILISISHSKEFATAFATASVKSL